ncbi:MAG: MerR family transcriptional regulator [Streptosporangiales bacterium]
MRISQLATRTGVPASTLRFYETIGLLTADRTDAGYRVYGEDAVERLAFIGSAKHLGLSLEEIAELVRVRASGTCAQVKHDLRPRLVQHLHETERRAMELAGFAASLRAVLEHLDALPDRQERCGPECELTVDRPAAGVACSLTGQGMNERADEWHRALAGARHQEIPGGVVLMLPAERAATVAGLAVAEQQCCPFFAFRINLDGPVLHLEVRAPADAAGLLIDLFTAAA